MNSDSPSFVPLRHASLCLDCDVISAAQTNCIACGSSAPVEHCAHVRPSGIRNPSPGRAAKNPCPASGESSGLPALYVAQVPS